MSNTIYALWIGLAAVLLLLFVYAAVQNLRRRRSDQVELGALIPSFLPVDVEVLSKLIDPAQHRQLQETFGRDELRRIQRKQVQLTIECLRRMTHNAALLQQLGYSQLRSGNELICTLAQEMIDAGVHVRLYTFMGLIVLHVWSALRLGSVPLIPRVKSTNLRELLSASLIPAYALLKDKADNLTCLKFANFHEALIQSL
jgi:hypothetical protein